MSERTVTAESVRVSRAAQHAAEMAVEAQEQARLARLEAAEMRVHRTLQALAVAMAALWLIGLAVLLIMEVRF
jgi:formate/nitrite transporter FocA (FNT family)